MPNEIKKLTDLRYDPRNANKGTPRGLGMVEKSLRQYGAGRSILVDKDDNVIAGNKTLEAAVNAGIENIRVVETDGNELVVVKRKDVKLDSKRGRELAIADNRSGQVGLDWDIEELATLKDEGINVSEFWNEQEWEDLLESFVVPDFSPVGIDEQGRLDEKAKCTCPECGHTFTP